MPDFFSPVLFYLQNIFCLQEHLKKIFPILILSLMVYSVGAEQLAIKNFSIPDGLARNQVTAIYPDSPGFIWIGTADGLSRFDGYGFSNYSSSKGLPHPVITGIAEAEKGVYWVATQGGLCLINFNQPPDEKGSLHLKIIKLEESGKVPVYSIFLDSKKRLWAGTRDGIFRVKLENNSFHTEKIILKKNSQPRQEGSGNIIEDRRQNIWVSAPEGLFRIDSADKIVSYTITRNDYFDRLGNISMDQNGRFWIGGLDGLIVFQPTTKDEELREIPQSANKLKLPENPGEFAFFDEKNGIVNKRVLETFCSSDNQIWIATRRGISLFNGREFKNFTIKNGLVSDEILTFGEDTTGNIWIGTESTGVMRVARNGFTTYTTADGLIDNRISSVFEGHDGEIYSIDGNRNVSRFIDDRFVSIKPNFPKRLLNSAGVGKIRFCRMGKANGGLELPRGGSFSKNQRFC